jgi:hypothetical protein
VESLPQDHDILFSLYKSMADQLTRWTTARAQFRAGFSRLTDGVYDGLSPEQRWAKTKQLFPPMAVVALATDLAPHFSKSANQRVRSLETFLRNYDKNVMRTQVEIAAEKEAFDDHLKTLHDDGINLRQKIQTAMAAVSSKALGIRPAPNPKTAAPVVLAVWHDKLDPPPKDWYGPVTGTRNQLAKRIGVEDTHSLDDRLRYTGYWGRKMSSTSFELYFQNKQRYEAATQG